MVSSNNLSCNGDVDVLKSFILDSTPPEKLLNGVKQNNCEKTYDATSHSDKKGSSFRQVFIAILANLGTINTGMTFGFSAVAIPQLQQTDSPIPLDDNQASWVASLSSIGTPCGCILSAYLTDAVGRKWTLFITEVPSIIGWIMIASAPSIEWIYIGRILTGLGSGMIGAPSRVYTAEVTQPHLRGMLAALASVGMSLGVALEYFFGSIFSWSLSAALSTTIPALALVTSLLLPESPSWLITRGRQGKCLNSLKRLRGSTCDINLEAKDLVAFSQRHNSCSKMSPKQKLRAVLHPSAVKPFFILTTYFLIYQLSGTNPITFYSTFVFQDAAITMDKYAATVLMGVFRLVFTIIGCILMLQMGRRPLTFISGIGCGITALLLGAYIYMVSYWNLSKTVPVVTWFPLVTIIMFTVFTAIGYLIVPWVMIGEVYPVKVRGLIGGLTTCLCHFYVFIAVKTYPWLRQWCNPYGPFIIYGLISLVGSIYLYLFLPETKGKSLQEIEETFCKKKNQTLQSIEVRRPIVQNKVLYKNEVSL